MHGFLWQLSQLHTQHCVATDLLLLLNSGLNVGLILTYLFTRLHISEILRWLSCVIQVGEAGSDGAVLSDSDAMCSRTETSRILHHSSLHSSTSL